MHAAAYSLIACFVESTTINAVCQERDTLLNIGVKSTEELEVCVRVCGMCVIGVCGACVCACVCVCDGV